MLLKGMILPYTTAQEITRTQNIRLSDSTSLNDGACFSTANPTSGGDI